MERMTNSKVSRNPYFDMLRGLAIIMVVGIHTFPKGINGLNSFGNASAIVLRLFLNCAVPIFLGISGYFIGQKNVSTIKSYCNFLWHQIPSVYIPCLVFSFVWYIIETINIGHLSIGLTVLCFCCGLSVYYFIALIIQYYLLLPFLQKMTKHWTGLVVSVIISFISIAIMTYVTKVQGHSLALLYYAGPFPVWVLFFCIGVYFATHSRDYYLLWPLLIMGGGMILQIIEYNFFLTRGQDALGIKLSSFVFSAGVVWLVLSNKLEANYLNSKVSHSLNYIGKMSFGIYLTHVFFIRLWRMIWDCNIWIVNWIAVLCFSVTVIYVTRIIAPNFSSKYLGFRG